MGDGRDALSSGGGSESVQEYKDEKLGYLINRCRDSLANQECGWWCTHGRERDALSLSSGSKNV